MKIQNLIVWFIIWIPFAFSSEMAAAAFCYPCCIGNILTKILPVKKSSITIPKCFKACCDILFNSEQVDIDLNDEISFCTYIGNKLLHVPIEYFVN